MVFLEFKHPWLPNSPRKIKEAMLKDIGVSDVKDLYIDVPEEVKFKGKLNVGLGRPLSECEAKRFIDSILSKAQLNEDFLSFLGAGCWLHHVPAVVGEILRRSEFYSSYAPYQAEISQGICQALFEYQSLIADLTEMDVVNASMYDMSTSIAEAFLMASRTLGRSRFLVPKTMNPMHLDVVETFLKPKELKVVKVSYNQDSGLMDVEDLKSKVDGDTAAVYIENPSYLGFIEPKVEEIAEVAHENSSLLIVGVDPISLGVLRPPGDYGADVVVGEGQPLGLGLNYGGPLLGIFAIKLDGRLLRQMPGRVIGMTTTFNGERGFAMVLQTREQHVRRERATSNICTNEALCAIAAAVYLSLLGPSGLRRLCETILYNSNYAMRKLSSIAGVRAPIFRSFHFKEFTVSFNEANVSVEEVNERLLKDYRIHGGKVIKKEFPELGEAALYCVTEVHGKEDVDRLADALKDIVEV